MISSTVPIPRRNPHCSFSIQSSLSSSSLRSSTMAPAFPGRLSSVIIGAHPQVTLFNVENRHPLCQSISSIPDLHTPCQPGQHNNGQSRVNLIHPNPIHFRLPQRPLLERWGSSNSSSSTEGMMVRFRTFLECFCYRPTISPSFLLSFLMIFQILFQENQKCLSMAFLNSSYTWVFAHLK